MAARSTKLVDAKYGRVYLDGSVIPDSARTDGSGNDEPVFILRAQDDMALHTLTRYRNTMASIEDADKLPSPEWFEGLDAVIASFANYRSANPDLVKVPD